MPRGRPEGNPGNRGGGRKSLYEEAEAADWLKALWKGVKDGTIDVAELEARVLSKKYSASDMAALKMLKGNDRLLNAAMDKLIPDQHEVSGAGGGPIVVSWAK